MAISNIPYDDERIVAALDAGAGVRSETRDVRVDFTGTGITEDDVATVTATLTWTVPAPVAVRILDEARVLAEDVRHEPEPTDSHTSAAAFDDGTHDPA
ncbi:hypothetical protein [Clavibacter michiganensis]|uniref:hypothetical protein n=1 Tax=Clavibacter michiganensis TaxID=28447 RepID=UPI0015E1BF42|nr:hypothetical protein [Clavibacter michiganensis]